MTPPGRRVGRGATVAAVGQVIVGLIAFVAGLDSDGDTAGAFWLGAGSCLLGAATAAMLRPAERAPVRGATRLLTLAAGLAVLSAVIGGPIMLLVPALLLGLDASLLVGVRSEGRRAGQPTRIVNRVE